MYFEVQPARAGWSACLHSFFNRFSFFLFSFLFLFFFLPDQYKIINIIIFIIIIVIIITILSNGSSKLVDRFLFFYLFSFPLQLFNFSSSFSPNLSCQQRHKTRKAIKTASLNLLLKFRNPTSQRLASLICISQAANLCCLKSEKTFFFTLSPLCRSSRKLEISLCFILCAANYFGGGGL